MGYRMPEDSGSICANMRHWAVTRVSYRYTRRLCRAASGSANQERGSRLRVDQKLVCFLTSSERILLVVRVMHRAVCTTRATYVVGVTAAPPAVSDRDAAQHTWDPFVRGRPAGGRAGAAPASAPARSGCRARVRSAGRPGAGAQWRDPGGRRWATRSAASAREGTRCSMVSLGSVSPWPGPATWGS